MQQPWSRGTRCEKKLGLCSFDVLKEQSPQSKYFRFHYIFSMYYWILLQKVFVIMSAITYFIIGKHSTLNVQLSWYFVWLKPLLLTKRFHLAGSVFGEYFKDFNINQDFIIKKNASYYCQLVWALITKSFGKILRILHKKIYNVLLSLSNKKSGPWNDYKTSSVFTFAL